MLGQIGAICIAVLLALAAGTDIAYRIIPNWIVILVAGIGLGLRLVQGPWSALVSAAIAAGMFGLLLIAHARGALGGGDVKLIAAVAAGFPPNHVVNFVFATAFAGGALGVVHLLGRFLVRRYRPRKPLPHGANFLHRMWRVEIWRLARHGSLPYGVAIAFGGWWALFLGSGN